MVSATVYLERHVLLTHRLLQIQPIRLRQTKMFFDHASSLRKCQETCKTDYRVASSGWVPGQGAGTKKEVEEAQATGRNPTDRGKCGTKRHLLTDGAGVPLAVVISGANRHDMKKLGELLDASLVEQVEPMLEQHLCLDRGYDYKACREQAVEHGYIPHIPPNATSKQLLPAPDDPQRHPSRRWVVEVSHAWFNHFRRRLVRRDKLAVSYLGFVQLAASLIIYRKLRHARTLSG